MTQIQKQFFVGMDHDTNLQDMKEGSYRYALNCRIGSSDKGNIGMVENVKGNTEVEFTLPAGENTCIGSLGDEKTQSIIYFLHNEPETEVSAPAWATATAYVYGNVVTYLEKKYKCIITHNPISSGISLICTTGYNPTNTPFWEEYLDNEHQIMQFFPHGSSPYIRRIFKWGPLNFNKDKKIHSSFLVDDILYWTDANSIPRKLNVEKANEDKLLECNIYFEGVSSLSGDIYFIATSPDGTIAINTLIMTAVSLSKSDLLDTYVTAFNNNVAINIYFEAERFNDYIIINSTAVNGNWNIVSAWSGGNTQAVHQNMYQRPYVNKYISQLRPRLDAPEFTLVEASTLLTVTNGRSIENNQFQFSCRAIYGDNEKGVWSPLTRLVETRTALLADDAYIIQLQANFDNIRDILSDINYIEFAFREYEGAVMKIIKACPPFEFAHGGNSVNFDFNASYNAIDPAEFAIQFSDVPRLSNTAAVIKERAFLIKNLNNYTLPDLNINLTMDQMISNPDAAVTYLRSLKFGSKGQFGIVFYDEFKTNSLVYTDDGLRYYIPFWTEDMGLAVPDVETVGPVGSSEHVRTLGYEFNDSIPPIWAHSAQWVKTKDKVYSLFYQVNTLAGTDYVQSYDIDGNPVFYDTDPVYQHGLHLALAIHVDIGTTFGNYIIEEGDIVRERFRYSGEPEGIKEWVVVGFDDTLRVILKKSNEAGSTSYLGATGYNEIEFRKPKISEDNLFYETGVDIPIINPGTSTRAFGSTSGAIEYYDVHSRTDTDGVAEGEYMFYNVSGARSYNAGNPNISDRSMGESTAPTTITISDRYISGTKINGLSSFSGISKIFPIEYGPIRKLIPASNESESNVLLAIHENKTVSIYVGQTQFTDTVGTNIISQSSEILGSFNTMQEDYGTVNPESVARNNDNVYWFDLNKSAPVRYGGNGLDNLAEMALMKKYFLNKSKTLRRYHSSDVYREQVKIYGTFDGYNNEYILTFPEIVDVNTGAILSTAETIAFSENYKRWTTFYSYIPEYSDKVGDVMVTYKQGKLYIH